LGQEGGLVDQTSVFGELSVLDAADPHLLEAHRLAGRRDAPEGPRVSAGSHEVHEEPICLGDGVDRGHDAVRERREETPDQRAVRLEIRVAVVRDVVGRMEGDEAIEIVGVVEPELLIGDLMRDVDRGWHGIAQLLQEPGEVEIAPVFDDLSVLDPVDRGAGEECGLAARGQPKNSPVWVPPIVHRVATLSPSATWSSTVNVKSAKAGNRVASPASQAARSELPPRAWLRRFVEM
jgi:hypothetical protein